MKSIIAIGIRLAIVPITILNLYLIFKIYGENAVALNAIFLSFIPIAGIINFGFDGSILQIIARLGNKIHNHKGYVGSINSFIRKLQYIAILTGFLVGFLAYEYIGKRFGVSIYVFIFCMGGIFLAGLQPLCVQYFVCLEKKILANLFLIIGPLLTSLFLILDFGRGGINEFQLTITVPFYVAGIVFVFASKYEKSDVRNKVIKLINKNSNGYNKTVVLGLMTIGLDYFILNAYISPSEIADYNVISKFYLISVNILNIYLGTNNIEIAKLYRECNTNILFKKIQKWRRNGLLVILMYLIFLSIFIDSLVNIISNGIVVVDLWSKILFSILILVRFFSDFNFSILHSCNKTGAITYLMLPQAIISVALQIFLTKYIGYYGLLLGIIISYLSTQLWYLEYKLLEFKKNE